ncbi:MAG: efflux RND transporter periplasmic adaptor subunit [Desulfobacterales bacterium]|nr:efflux RND transporter periplasmic adaptor subunit [Desulfobacterales bacterium]
MKCHYANRKPMVVDRQRPAGAGGMARRSLALTVFAIICPALLACSEQPSPPVETVRAIRTFEVGDPAEGQKRRFSGVVEAADNSAISFEVAGNVHEVHADVGQQIEKGQVLAVMDDRTFRMNVAAAQAAVGRAEVERNDARSERDRVRKAAEINPGAVSQRSIDQAETQFNSARKNMRYHQSQLDLAQRDLERTVLKAPFDGVVATRQVDPFQQVSLGQILFELYAEGAMEAAISVPESEIDRVHLGLPAEIRFPAIPDQIFPGTVSEISRVAGGANAFPVKAMIDADNPRIRPGITAEVTLLLGDDEDGAAYLIPSGALLAGPNETRGFVFVFDPATSTVRKTAVTFGGVRESNVIVRQGLKTGDVIAAAGVSFMRDGQKVIRGHR